MAFLNSQVFVCTLYLLSSLMVNGINTPSYDVSRWQAFLSQLIHARTQHVTTLSTLLLRMSKIEALCKGKPDYVVYIIALLHLSQTTVSRKGGV